MNKRELLDSIIEEQKKVTENLEANVKRYSTASDLEENSADPDELSHQTEAKDMQLRFEKMLHSAEHDLSFLENLGAEKLETIEKGSIIETETHYLFVGVSTTNFNFDGKNVICFTEEAPIYKELENKKIGDSFKIGDNEMEIINIQ